MLSPVTGESVRPRIGFLPGTSGVVAAAAAGGDSLPPFPAGALVTAGFSTPAGVAGAVEPGAAGSADAGPAAGEADAGGDAAVGGADAGGDPAGVDADASLRLSCPSSI